MKIDLKVISLREQKNINEFFTFSFVVYKFFNMFEVQCVLHCMCVWGLKLGAAVELPLSFAKNFYFSVYPLFRFK